ncbi:hypothetical protein ACJX0J_022965 [Zea mays]
MDRAKVHENTDQIEINIREGAAVQKCFEVLSKKKMKENMKEKQMLKGGIKNINNDEILKLLETVYVTMINLYTSDFIADLIMNLATLNFKNSEDTCYHEDSEMVPSPGRASPVVASVQSHKNFVDHADLEIVPSHENSVDLHSVYMAHVLERSRQSIVVDILDYNIPESTFADCLLPTGHMHTDVFYLQCQLLSKDWKDKVILSWKATQELIHQDIGWIWFSFFRLTYLDNKHNFDIAGKKAALHESLKEAGESEAAVIIEIENRDDKTLEDEHISVEKE